MGGAWTQGLAAAKLVSRMAKFQPLFRGGDVVSQNEKVAGMMVYFGTTKWLFSTTMLQGPFGLADRTGLEYGFRMASRNPLTRGPTGRSVGGRDPL